MALRREWTDGAFPVLESRGFYSTSGACSVSPFTMASMKPLVLRVCVQATDLSTGTRPARSCAGAGDGLPMQWREIGLERSLVGEVTAADPPCAVARYPTAGLSVPLHPSGRDLQQPAHRRRRHRRHVQVQGLPDQGARPLQDHDAQAGRVHPPLPHPRLAKRVPPDQALRSARQRHQGPDHRAGA